MFKARLQNNKMGNVRHCKVGYAYLRASLTTSMKQALTLFCIVVLTTAQAQDKTVQQLQADAARNAKRNPADTLPKKWHKGGTIGVNISQGSLSNWAAGGDNFSLAVNSLVSLYAFYKKDKQSWDNTFDFNYGLVRSTSLGSRKNDDRIDLFSKYGIAIAPKWNIAALGNFRTQFFKGYTYTDSTRTLSSAFLSPAYALLGAGFDYKPSKAFSLYLSPVTGRVTIVKDDSLAAHGAYGVDSGQHAKWEVGAFLSANYLKEFNKVLAYKGRLDLYSNYRHNPQNIDVYMTNMLSIKFSRALSATWNVDLIYDDDVKLFGKNKNAPALQLKSLVGIGLLIRLDNLKKGEAK
jgi:hypothetical protein